MATNPIEEQPTPESIARYIKSNAARVRKAQQMHHGDPVSTREADYKGHHIVVRTRYEVEIDGKPLMGHMGVNDAGAVHYHPVPNMSFASALDLVRKVIDVFPEDFGPDAPDHTSHDMPGMSMKKSGPAKKTAKPAKRGRK
jgi:hypothetical protein